MKAALELGPQIKLPEIEYLHDIWDVVLNPEDAEIIVAAGGDNTMLNAIHNHFQYGKPFFGMNFGRVGFLLNNNKADFPEVMENIIANAKMINLWMLECFITYEDDSSKTMNGFNDIWLSAVSGQTIRMNLTIDDRKISGTVVGDGLIFSTPQGSTGYARSAGGMIIKPSIPVIQITPKACTIGERRVVMTPIIERDDSVITVEFEDFQYRKCEVFADGNKDDSTKHIKTIQFRKSHLRADLLFSSSSGFYDKMYDLQYHQ